MRKKFLLFCVICFMFTANSTAFAIDPVTTGAAIIEATYKAYQWWKDGEKVSEELKRMRAQTMTALMEASYNDSVQEIQRLLDAGEQINAKDFDADTALCYAVSGNTPEVVKFLIDKGAYINEKILKYTIKRNNPEILRVILQNKKFSKDTLNESLLSTKNENFNIGVIIALLDAGADINYNDSSRNNETILMYLLSLGDVEPEIINTLVNYSGIKLAYTCDKDRRTVLMYAAQYCKNKDVMKILIDSIKDKHYINFIDANGTTALMYAAQYNTPEVVKALLNGGADPNIKDKSGNKAVDYAMGWFGGNSSVKNSPVFERLGKSDRWIRPYW